LKLLYEDEITIIYLVPAGHVAVPEVQISKTFQYPVYSSLPIEILSENEYYVRARVINSTYNALHVANSIYESGWVTYSHPSFIVEIEFDI
jgi:hypothetical protein